ncbi:MAG: S41 family peptidase [Myxococcota bacterium]
MRLLLCCLCVSCAAPEYSKVRLSAGLEPVVGIWKSDGYGYLIDARQPEVAAYELTQTTCLPIPSDGATFADYYDTVTLSRDGALAQFANDGEAHPVRYRRVLEVPPRCQQVVPASLVQVFRHFSAYFAEHYIFFDVFAVDWGQRVAEASRTVSDDMSEEALFETLVHMLRGIRDAHVELKATIDGERRSFDAGEGMLPELIARNATKVGASPESATDVFLNSYWKENIPKVILQGKGTRSANGALQWGMAGERSGYLALISEGYFAEGKERPSLSENRSAVRSLIRTALDDLRSQGATALVVDLSVNFGGFDYVSREFAAALIAEPVLAYSKQAQDTEHTIPPTDYRVQPAPFAFDGPVFLLTTDVTVSAGEILTLALRKAPNVIHVGEPTRGSLSDKLEKPLPNGWELTLSNELYLDGEGTAWEGKGIAPEEARIVFNSDDPLASHLAAVQAP